MLLDEGTPAAEDVIEQIGADVEETEVVEAEAPSQPADTTEVKPDTPTPEVPRDERGRFAEKVPTPDAQTAEAVSTPAETPVEPTAPEAEAPEDIPATYRADGQEFQIPGSAVGVDGTFISTDVWQREVLPLLAAGRAARGGSLQKRLQESTQQIQHWQQQANAAQAQSQAIIAKIDQMVEANTIGEWLEGVQQNWPILKARAEADALRMQQQAMAQQLQTHQAEQQRQALEPQFSQALEQSLMHYGSGLSQEQLQGLYAQLNTPQLRNALFVRAQQDDPMTGLRAGEWAIDNGVVEQWVRWASQYQPKPSTPTIPAKVAKAVQQNEQKAAAVPPPVVGGKGGAAPSQKPRPKQYKDGHEALKKIFDDEEFQNFEVVE